MFSWYGYTVIRISVKAHRLFGFVVSGSWAIGFGVTWCAPVATYTGSNTCGQCHARELRQQSMTGHARALYRAAEHPLHSWFAPDRPFARAPDYKFRFSLDEKGYRVQVFDAKDVITAPIEWAFGAGQQAVTFASRVDRNWYVEHYFTYYTALGRMGVTPGQQAINPKALPEAVGLVYKAVDEEEGIVRCFRCHSTGPVDTAGAEIQPFETGVHCEACHGPGSEHVRTADAKLIANPKRMDATELNQFCGRCHRPPNSRGPAIDWNYSWNVRHQPVYLAESACFRKSTGALSCLSCHHPHEALQRSAGYYNRVCLSCHAVAHKNQGVTNCIDCHMPMVSPQNALRFTNHWIGIYLEGAKLRPISSR